MRTFFAVGGDMRLRWMVQILSKEGYPVSFFTGTDSPLMKSAVKEASVILGPVPFTRDGVHLFQPPSHGMELSALLSCLMPGQYLFGGNLPDPVKEFCDNNDILWKDFMDMEEISLENAIATAEGAISLAISQCPINLHRCRCLILGYGRCGQALADRLRGMFADASVCEITPIRQTLAKTRGFDTFDPQKLEKYLPQAELIFNTAPAPILTDPLLIKQIHKDAVLFELASGSGCISEEACRQAGLCRIACPGLPGRFSPKASARILCRAVLQVLGEGR